MFVPFGGLLIGLTVLAIGSGPNTNSSGVALLSRHLVTAPTITLSMTGSITMRVTRATGGYCILTGRLLDSFSVGGFSRVGRLRRRASGCRSTLNSCLLGLASSGVGDRSDEALGLLLCAVNSVREVTSRTTSISLTTGRVCRGSIGFSRRTGNRVLAVHATMNSLLSGAVRTCASDGLRLTGGIRPRRRMISLLMERYGSHRVRHLHSNGYAIRCNFILSSLLATCSEATSRYSSVTTRVVRTRRNEVSVRGCLSALGTNRRRNSRCFSGGCSRCLRHCRLPERWGGEGDAHGNTFLARGRR